MFTWFNIIRVIQQAHKNILVMLATAESVEMLADGNSPADWDYAADSFADPFADF